MTSGECGDRGDNVTWSLDDSGTLTISGTGKMMDYHSGNYTSVPWYDNRERIQTIVIQDGVTSIGNKAFSKCINLYSTPAKFAVRDHARIPATQIWT